MCNRRMRRSLAAASAAMAAVASVEASSITSISIRAWLCAHADASAAPIHGAALKAGMTMDTSGGSLVSMTDMNVLGAASC